MAEKTFKISKSGGRSKETIFEGTLAELTEKFSYTLLLGNQQNPKIKTQPKNINELRTALQKSYDEIEAAAFSKTFIDIVK